jgi:magnesium-protoporphyrin O-methyltransferase
MAACCRPDSADTGKFFSLFAGLERRRYLRSGLETSQRQLIEGVTRAGIEGASLLDIGSGVGYLHQHLLKHGLARATGVDLSERMIEEARQLAKSLGTAERTDYRTGDFVDIADTLSPSEVVILDKVICCYPDPETLVCRSLAKAQRVYAYTLPRDRWYTRAGAALIAVFMRLLRSRFRPYVHDPARVDGWVISAGFRRHYEAQTPVWLTRVYVLA